jgi:hypothetical protein
MGLSELKSGTVDNRKLPAVGTFHWGIVAKRTCHTLGDFPYMGRLPMHGRTSRIWEVVPCMGSLPICAKTSNAWELWPYMGRLVMYGKSSRILDGLVIYGTSPHIWEDFPCMATIPIYIYRYI